MNKNDMFALKGERSIEVMIRMKVEAYFKFMELTGLEMTEKTGGRLSGSCSGTISRPSDDLFQWTRKGEPDIIFVSGESFWKTVRETEDSLNIKLFI